MMYMNNREPNRANESITDSLFTMSRNSWDKLRAAQKIMQNLYCSGDRGHSFEHTTNKFLYMSQSEQQTIIHTINLHIQSGLYDCLAIDTNKWVIIEQLNDIITKAQEKEWFFTKKYRHGPKQNIEYIIQCISSIQTKVENISIQDKELTISPQLSDFIHRLNDNELWKIILFTTKICNIKSCRDRYYHAVDKDYIEQELWGRPNWLSPTLDKLISDSMKFLRDADEKIISEIAQADFQGLAYLITYLEQYRADRFWTWVAH